MRVVGSVRIAAPRNSDAGMPVQEAEHDWNKKQSRHRRQREPANDRSTERRVLFAAFSKADCHRQHANDHCQGRHEHRSQAARARIPRGVQRIHAPREVITSKAHHEHRIGSGDPQAHDRSH